MKILALAFIAVSTLASSVFAGELQDTLDNIYSELQEINQRARDEQFSYDLEHASYAELLRFERLVKSGQAFETETETPKVEVETPQQHQRWLEQQKANLRSRNPWVREQARANLGIK